MKKATRTVLLLLVCVFLTACRGNKQEQTPIYTGDWDLTPETYTTTAIYVRPEEDKPFLEESMPEDEQETIGTDDEQTDSGESTGSQESGSSITGGTLVSNPKQDGQSLTWANIRAFPIKSSSMTTAQLRNLCVDFFRFAKTALWTPDESIRFYCSDSGGLDSMTAGVWYGGLPYTGTSNGNVYRLMDYLDESTGVVDMSDALNLTGDTLTRKDMEYFGNQCANGAHQGWARVINSVNGTITAYTTKNRGYIPLGEYTYDYAKIDYWQNVDGYRTSDVVKANGKQTMYRSYAKLQIGDGLVYFTTAGHVIMCSSEPHVEYDADGKINGNLSYITIIDQSGNWVERKTAKGIPYTMKDSVDAKVTFSQLYNNNYLPFTFAEFTGADPVETTSCTFSHTDSNITASQLFSARVESNYTILDVYVIVTDSQGTMVYKHAVRNPDSFAKQLRMARSGSNVDTWGMLKSGTYSVRVEAQLGTGERPVIYTGTLTA